MATAGTPDRNIEAGFALLFGQWQHEGEKIR
jgi:hypothetical protein